MSIPFLDIAAAHAEVREELDRAYARVRDRGSYILGAEVEAFEQEFAEYCGVAHCIGVGNGFDAIHLLLRACGVGPGDDVLVPAYTAVATWMAVLAAGATPVGVDVDMDTWTMDVDAAAAAVTSRTAAIMPVHLFGVPAALAPLHELAERHGLLLLEDAAQAHGALYRNRRVGSLGRAATFSFYPTKNLGAIGDGGAVVTDDAEIAETVRMLRAYGWRERSNSERHGFNSRLDELQAAFLRVKLRRLDGWNDRRRAVAARYAERLTVTGVRAVSPPSDVDPVWHLYVIATTSRDHLRSTLADAGIGTLVHYHPLPHLTPAFRADGWAEGSLPVAEQLAAEALSLPMFPQLTMQDCDSVVAAIEHATATARG